MHNRQDSFSAKHHPPEGSQPGKWKIRIQCVFELTEYNIKAPKASRNECKINSKVPLLAKLYNYNKNKFVLGKRRTTLKRPNPNNNYDKQYKTGMNASAENQ